MTKCSYCGRENADDCPNCSGCGTELRTKIFNDRDSGEPRREAGRKRMVNGALWFFGGAAVTLFTYAEAVRSPYGGHYFIAWGAIFFGAMRFFQGRAASALKIDPKLQARDLLELAAQLESADPAKASELYEEIIKTFPGTPAGEEAQRNLKTLTGSVPHPASNESGCADRRGESQHHLGG